MSRKALLTTVAVVVLGAVAWVFARQLWQAVLRLHGHCDARALRRMRTIVVSVTFGYSFRNE